MPRLPSPPSKGPSVLASPGFSCVLRSWAVPKRTTRPHNPLRLPPIGTHAAFRPPRWLFTYRGYTGGIQGAYRGLTGGYLCAGYRLAPHQPLKSGIIQGRGTQPSGPVRVPPRLSTPPPLNGFYALRPTCRCVPGNQICSGRGGGVGCQSHARSTTCRIRRNHQRAVEALT
jgi:hypothetical protein